MTQSATFAIPGDITTTTGGYIYERRLLEGLRDLGHDVEHLRLGRSFPDPTPKDMSDAVIALERLNPERALILDGLVYGAIQTDGLSRVRCPIVAMIHHPLAHETGLSADRQRHLFQTERDNLALAAHVLVPSEHTAHMLSSEYGVPRGRITIAQPGTDRADGVSAPIDPPLILSVGILHPRKGHDVLLHALSQLKHLEWRAEIVGKVHDEAFATELVRMIEDLQLSNRVRLAGLISAAQLHQLYSAATLFALATRYEGYGMVFDEALAWGLPIVSCKTGAVAQTIPDGAGTLVRPDAPNDLANAIARMLQDVPMRCHMADVAKRAGRALPTWNDTARTAGSVLDGLRSGAPRCQ